MLPRQVGKLLESADDKCVRTHGIVSLVWFWQCSRNSLEMAHLVIKHASTLEYMQVNVKLKV